MEAAGIETHSQTPPISPHIGETPRSPALSTAAALDQVVDTDSTGHVEETGQASELVSANRSDISDEPDADDSDCPDARPELEMGMASSSSQCSADATRDITRFSTLECADEMDIEYSDQVCHREQDSSNAQQQGLKGGCEPANTEADRQEISGLATGVRREDEEDLDALMQELAELRSPRPDEAAVSLTPDSP
jgi:hypothetical protein